MAQQARKNTAKEGVVPTADNDAAAEGSAVSRAAQKIRAHRKANSLTAADLAEKLGVSQPAVIYWETGKKVPRHPMQGKLQELGICAPNDWHLPAQPETGIAAE